MTPHEHESLRLVIARAEIRSVLERYFFGLDARDENALHSCFSNEAYYEANTGQGRKIVFNGASEIASTLVRLMGRFEATLHLTASPFISIEGNRATADVFGSAQLCFAKPTEDGHVLVRGVRYRDELEKVDGYWRITRRVHTTLWQYNASSVEPFVPSANGIDK
nr:nuclear transport factor 2 family protein [Pseudomonas sp. 21LCFQ02]